MILTFDKVGWFNNNIRGFFSTIDHLIYSLLSWIIEGIFNLSNLTSSPAFTQTIYKRIYLILGVYMIFKLSFSFLKYLVNPDSMTDKEQGVGKLIARTVTMVCMLILLPIIFFTDGLVPGTKGTVLNVLQDGVLKTIPNIIFGAESNQESVAETADESGDYLALMMLRSFYYPKECSDNNADTNVCDISGEGKNTKVISSLDEFTETINDEDWDNVYDYQYMWPLTTVAGVLLVVIMLGIAIDVAIRVFKLILLQMMAPIPVMSYIDPKSSKDGAFNSWLKTFISTYIDIFVKLAVVYLILLLASKLFAGNGKGLFAESISNVDGFMSRNFVRVFLVIGLFKFAKDAPKFIKDAMSIKDSGGGGLFGGLATLGAAAGTIGGATAGLVGGAAGGIAAAKAAGNNKFLGAMKGIGGGAAGLVRGGAQGAKGAAKGNLFKGMSGAIAAQNAVSQRKITAAQDGSTWTGRMKSKASEFFTGQNAADRDEQRLAQLQEEKSKYDTSATAQGNLYDYIMDKAVKAGSSTVVGAAFRGGTLNTSYDKFNTAYQTAKSKGASTFSIRDDSTGAVYSLATNSGEAAKLAGDLQEASATAWATANADDAALQQYENQAGVENGHYDAVGLKASKKSNEAESRRVARESFDLKTSKGYKANKANATAIKRNGK